MVLKRFIYFILFGFTVLTVNGQNTPVSSLPTVDSLGQLDFFPVVQAGHYHKAYISQLPPRGRPKGIPYFSPHCRLITDTLLQRDSLTGTTIFAAPLSNRRTAMFKMGNINDTAYGMGMVLGYNPVLNSNAQAVIAAVDLSKQGMDSFSIVIQDNASNNIGSQLVMQRYWGMMLNFQDSNQVNGSNLFLQPTSIIMGSQTGYGSNNLILDTSGLMWQYHSQALYKFPNTQGLPGQAMVANASGNLGWQTLATGGADTVQCLQSITVNISAAQILNSYAHPDTLIPAPGPGKQINLLSLQGFYTYETISYSGTSTGLFLGDTVQALDNFMIGEAIGSYTSSSFKAAIGQVGGGFFYPQSGSYINQPLVFYSRTFAPTSGDGTLQLTLVYTVTDNAGHTICSNDTFNSPNTSAWGLTGNSGTSPATNFIGTTDNQDLLLKRNGYTAIRLASVSGYGNAVEITDSIGRLMLATASNDSGSVYQINIGDLYNKYNGTLFGVNVASRLIGCHDSVFIDEGAIQIEDVPRRGKVLTSDANGLASWQTPTGGGTGYATDTSITVFLDSNQIKNSYTNPVVIIPAPGAGYQIQISSGSAVFTPGTDPYNGGYNNPVLIEGDTLGQVAGFSIITSLANPYQALMQNSSGAQSVPYSNQPVSFYYPSPTYTNFSRGSGSLQLFLTYKIINSTTGAAKKFGLP